MTEIFIIISKFLFIFYIAAFLLNGFLISLSKEELIQFKELRGLSNQRICIVLFHITASVILITSQIQYELNKTVIYCVAGLVLVI